MSINIANINHFFKQCGSYRSNKASHITGSIARTLLALTFLFSGFVKSVDPLGTVYKVEDYLTAMGLGGLVSIAGTLAVLLIVAEWILGWMMLFNVQTKWTSWGALLFMLIMTPLTLWIAITGAVHDCGCFGDALVLTNWQTFWKNVVLLSLVLILLYCKKGIPQLFSWWAELGIVMIGLGITAGIMGYSYTHLPIIDFRPYKVGNNILELTSDPETVSIVKHTMTKDGIYKEFSNEEYMAAKNDGWEWYSQTTEMFIKANNKLVPIKSEEDLVAKIEDFKLYPFAESLISSDDLEDDENDDRKSSFTEEFLSKEKVTMICMCDLYKANKKQAARAVDLYNSIISKGEECYFITNSTEADILSFAETNEIDIWAFITLDEKPLETVIRANPGVVVLQNGVVKEKHNMRQL
jgi:uncharacterized membrane protein YphA (DoxX/SURF4 family)